MATEVQELVVKMTPQGIAKTTEKLENQQEQFQQTTEQAAEQAGILSDFAQKWQNATGIITEGLGATIGTIADSIPLLGTFLSLGTLGFAAFLSRVPAVQEVFSGLVAVVNSLALELSERLRPVLEPVTNLLFELADAISSGDWAQVTDLVSKFVSQFRSVDWQGLISDAVSAFQKFLDVTNLTSVIDSFLGVGGKLASVISDFFTNVIGKIDWVSIITGVIQGLASVAVTISQAMANFLSKLNYIKIIQSVVDGLIGVANVVSDGFEELLSRLDFNNIIDTISSGLVGAASALTKGFKRVIRAVDWSAVGQTILNQVAKWLKNILLGSLDVVVSFTVNVAQWLINLAGEALSVTVDIFTDFVSGVVNWLVDTAWASVDLFTDFVSDVVDWLVNTASASVDLFTDFVSDVVDWLVNTASASVDLFVDTVPDWLKQLAKEALDVNVNFNATPDWLVNLGSESLSIETEFERPTLAGAGKPASPAGQLAAQSGAVDHAFAGRSTIEVPVILPGVGEIARATSEVQANDVANRGRSQ